MRWTGSTAFPALLPGCDDLIAAGDMTARHGKESVVQLRKGALPPTGIVCVNESTALGGLCLESGGKSPATSSERFDLRLIRLRGQVSLA